MDALEIFHNTLPVAQTSPDGWLLRVGDEMVNLDEIIESLTVLKAKLQEMEHHG